MTARVLPPNQRLQSLVDQGLTHQQIADLVTRETGYPVARATVSSALHRAGATSSAKKYGEELPWRIKDEHQTHYAPRMLRLLGRRRAGIRNSQESDDRLDSWLGRLREEGAVVVYLPNTSEGFYYVKGEWDHEEIPIKVAYKPPPRPTS